MTLNRKASKMALLVGANPLPNFIAVQILRPAQVEMLYSPQTKKPMELLQKVLREHGVSANSVVIKDATDAKAIQTACQNMTDVDHLHYSGGTKTMAVHVRRALKLSDEQASYLDERKGVFRFDDGYDVKIGDCDVGLTLETLLRLHGIEITSGGKDIVGAPTRDDVVAIAKKVFENPKLAKQIYDKLRPGGKRKSITEAKKSPWLPQEIGLSLSISSIPEEGWSRAQYKVWDDFLCGGWLERWTAEKIKDCLDLGGRQSPEIEVGIICKRTYPFETEFEIDVALIRGHRLYIVSCTTETRKALSKSKLFEVALRARQMGGDMARSALVCLVHGDDDHGPYIEQLRSDIASFWDAPNVPQVFGLEDLREWQGFYGEPNLESLKRWLEL